MTSETALVGAVRELLSERLLIEVGSPELDLIDSGLVDSIGVVELILEIESRFEVTLPTEEIEIDDLRSIQRIAMLVERKRPPLPVRPSAPETSMGRLGSAPTALQIGLESCAAEVDP